MNSLSSGEEHVIEFVEWRASHLSDLLENTHAFPLDFSLVFSLDEGAWLAGLKPNAFNCSLNQMVFT